jgi:RNA polymerase sigma-70 factor (ECF subfamily)
LTEQDLLILQGLKAGYRERINSEKELYLQYSYFINEGCKNHQLTKEDSFSAYSDTIFSAIHNIISDKFDGRSTLKTYLFQIFSNKCVDLLRKSTTNKEQVNKSMEFSALLEQLPDGAKNGIEKLIDDHKWLTIKMQMEKIGEKCKKILLMFEDGLKDREIAEVLFFNSPDVAKITRLRCLEKLKEKVMKVI